MSAPSATIELAIELIRRRSLTPMDAGCQKVLGDLLKGLGFQVEELRFGEVENLWARKGSSGPLFVFAGHTDVVPPGPEELWEVDPFEGVLTDGKLFGRGAADMKGAIAAMVTAAERFLKQNPNHKGSLAFLITSDEEGAAADGTAKVCEHLEKRGEKIDYCLVGEATSVDTVGDTMKNGRRGSLNGELTVYGVQGHVAYPERTVNPIHCFSGALAELVQKRWDSGNEFFPPTSFQVSNLNSGTGAENVVPGELKAVFNFRFSSAVSADELKHEVENICRKHNLDHQIKWRLSGKPFLTRPGSLTEAVGQAVKEINGKACALSTTGGTSDARFIAPMGAQVIELGPVNATIHKIDEHVGTAELDELSRIYERTLEILLAQP